MGYGVAGPSPHVYGRGSVVLGGAAGCAVVPHIAVLLIACTIQGMGSGLLVAVAYSMVSELYANDLRSRVLSAISVVWGFAALLGPTVGGMFAGIGWWRGAFWSVASSRWREIRNS
jgi:MFS family permease